MKINRNMAAMAAVLLLTTTTGVFASNGKEPPEDAWMIGRAGTAQAQSETEDKKTEENGETEVTGGDTIEIVPDSTPQAILNSAVLTPMNASSSDLDTYVDNLVAQLTTEDMSTYEKVKACYDYLVDNVSYGSHTRYLSTPIGATTCRAIYSGYGEVEGFGAVALTANVGMCNAYASAFILMTRALGLDSHLVEGSTGSARGGYAYHKWAEIDINGTTYVFDPQLEQNLRQSGLAPYTVFCKTYGEIPGRYIRSARNQ